jgi:hypothetical protein
VHDGLIDPQLLFITDEVYFHLSGYVNSQNIWVRSDENPHAVHQIPLHGIKTGVWCAVSAMWIIDRMIYHETVNSDRYVRNILEPFLNNWLMMKESKATFKKTILLRLLHAILWVHYRRCLKAEWLVRNCSLQDCRILCSVIYLWGNIKGNVIKNTPRTAEVPQNEVKNVTASVSADEVRRVTQGFLPRYGASLRANGDHSEHFL